VAKFTQQLIIRHSGPGLYAMFIAVRVVAAIAGSWLVLGEGIETWLEAAGCVIVTGSMTWYLWLQYVHDSRLEARGTAVAV
jgi:drug/metabolite transporter (DMT)-like permease